MNSRFLVLLLLVVVSLCGCGNSSSKAEKTKVKKVKKTELVNTVSQVLNKAERIVGQQIVITGKVKHVCQHSGRRCFLIDKDGKTIKVEASGDLKGFNKEVMGMTITVKGILREQRISKEDIDKISQKHKAAAEEEGHCGTESDNILNMRSWMKKNDKDYFAFYYIDGTDYTL